MSRLKLIMAVSADGLLARGPEDDMSWTGGDDKAAFRLMTMSGGVLGVGSRTYDRLPRLPGRTVVRISSQEASVTLGKFAYAHPDAWLLGGPTVALSALQSGLVGEAHLCRSPVALGSGIVDRITPFLQDKPSWKLAGETRFGEVLVEHWRNGRP
jgi:dihydrofolate reductase